MKTYLLDTDVIIECLRANKSIESRLKQIYEEGNLVVYTPVTISEIYEGLRKDEERKIEEFFLTMECLPITAEVGRIAGEFLKKFRKSHGVELGDALIAAAAHHYDAILFTLNKKHYPMLELRLV